MLDPTEQPASGRTVNRLRGLERRVRRYAAPDRARSSRDRNHHRSGGHDGRDSPAVRLPRRPGGRAHPARPQVRAAWRVPPQRRTHRGRALLSTLPPTAIFASSDVQALGVYEAARALGVAIPSELSVVGFDDLKIARWAGPAPPSASHCRDGRAGRACRAQPCPGAGTCVLADRYGDDARGAGQHLFRPMAPRKFRSRN